MLATIHTYGATIHFVTIRPMGYDTRAMLATIRCATKTKTNYQLSIVNYQLSIINCQLSIAMKFSKIFCPTIPLFSG